MHPALAIPELRTAICRELILPRWDDDTGYIDWEYWKIRLAKADLRSLALVSRAWTPIAEAVLWESLPSLTPLMCLLPEDAWTLNHKANRPLVNIDRSFKESFRLRRPLCAEDWMRVSRHARLVKDIWVLALQYSVEDQEQIARWLTQGEFLLPRLRRLDIVQYNASWVSPDFLGVLLSPSTIELKLWAFTRWPIPQWQSIISRFPQIASIELENPCHDFFCDAVWPGHHVRYSDVSGLEVEFLFPDALTTRDRLTAVRLLVNLDQCAEFILMMAACPRLEVLDFALRGSSDSLLTRTEVDIPYPSFRSLRSLSCLDAPTSLAQSIIASTRACRLQSIIIEGFDQGCTRDDLEKLLTTIRDHCVHNELTKFHLVPWQEHTMDIVLQLATLEPLAPFSLLEHVVIEQTRDMVLDVAHCEHIAGWWPNLVTLSLAVYTRQETSYCTLADIAPFSRLCPYLEKLQLDIDASTVPAAPRATEGTDADGTGQADGTKTAEWRPNFTLKFGDAPITDSAATAAYLINTFPSIVRVAYDIYGIAEGELDGDELQTEVFKQREEAWKGVNKIIREYQERRKVEAIVV